MAPREIIAIPDKRLRLKSEPVVKIDDSICALAEEMFEAMYAAPGIGLAAIQLGEPKRLRHGWINGIKELPVHYR